MGKIIRHEFLGNRLIVFILFCSGIGIPLGIIYLIEWFVTIEEEVADPEKCMEMLRRRTTR